VGKLMTEDKERSHDLLDIIEGLVDNLQETNNANTDMLHSVNLSLVKVSEALPEIKNVSEKVQRLDTESIISEVRTISTNLKIVVAIISILVSLGLIIFGLNVSKAENNIVNGVSTKIEKIFDDRINRIEKDIILLEDRKDK
jgi:predicted PurR-regulated permease PerM